ncbi:alpha/beta-hydrolase [Marasmius fiardii PR-910]|nr:alpha/beta-hydrolase [Marasmius fiardii PR-910]
MISMTMGPSRILLTVALILSTLGQTQAQTPSVTLDYGTFIGIKNGTTNITSFRGVRFADAPVGELRWRAAVSPPSKNLGTVNATKFANACIMNSQITAGTSEDCLFGNVFIPPSITSRSTPAPVLVWFHGGGFVSGDSHSADPTELFATTSEPFIFVSFEYRLGPFGFLAGSTVKNNGLTNAGLHDQRTALRWVQRYIGKFGGDPSRVTIWGQSAGAGSTMFHLIANNGDPEGLFHVAIGDSPSLNQMPATTDDYLESVFHDVATAAGCGNDTNLSCLRSVDINRLASAGQQTINARTATLYVFAPHFDGEFITSRPVEAFSSGKLAKVPVLFGANTNDGAHWSSELRDPNANTSMPNATQDTVYNFIHGQYPNFSKESFDRAVALYPLEEFNGSFSLQGQQMYGEARYICTAQLITAGAAIVGQNGFQFHYNNDHISSDHGAELAAFWGITNGADDKDRTLFEGMREFWSSLVTSGTQPRAKLARWTATNENGSPRMRLDPVQPGMEDVSASQTARCAFWHSISGEINT